MELAEGIEPPTWCLQDTCATYCAMPAYELFMEGSLGVEPSLAALQAAPSPRGNHPRVWRGFLPRRRVYEYMHILMPLICPQQ